MKQSRTCAYCNKEITGLSDKKYCDPYCKSNYHYQQTKVSEPRFYVKVDQQLKRNRRLLKAFNKSGKATVRAHRLKDLGFNPNFFTHFWKTSKDEVYLFVYEYGFLSRKEKGQEKYILIKWQPYMAR